MVTSVDKGGTHKLTKEFLELTDMTIHWKALEEHFLMVPFLIQPFLAGKCIF
jgi:hypothetical protein